MYLAHRDPAPAELPLAPSSPGRSAGGRLRRRDRAARRHGGRPDEGRCKDLGLDQNTLVMFTSDNGPVVPPKGPGSAGPVQRRQGLVRGGRGAGARDHALARADPRGARGERAREHARPLPDARGAHRARRCPPRHYDGQDISRLLTGRGGPDRRARASTAGARSSFFGAEWRGRPALGPVEVPAPGPLVGDDHALRPRGRPGREARPEPRASRPRQAARGRGCRSSSLSAAGAPSALRRLAGPLALAAASVLVTLLALEVAFRLAGVSVGHGPDQPRHREAQRQPATALRAAAGRAPSAPRSSTGSTREGLRGAETTLEKPAGRAPRRGARRLDRLRLLGGRRRRLPAPARGDARATAGAAGTASRC